MDKEISRRDFIISGIVGLLSLMSISSLIGLLTNSDSPEPSRDRPGYGISNYGP